MNLQQTRGGMDASGAVAIVTGASSGIGRATAEVLSEAGLRVFGTSREPREEPERWTLLPLDVRDDASVSAFVRSVLERVGRIDVLVNNAGYAQSGAVEENTIEDVRAQFDTNVLGALRVTRAVLPVMRRQRSGRIISVSSLLGRVAPAFTGVYASSKFALEALSEAMRAELRQFGVHVSVVEPGFVRTEIRGVAPSEPIEDYAPGRNAGQLFSREGLAAGLSADEVAAVILRVATMARPRLRYPIGGSSRLVMGLKRILPEGAFELFRRRAFPAERVAAPSAGAARDGGVDV